jgi:hypothetical protein
MHSSGNKSNRSILENAYNVSSDLGNIAKICLDQQEQTSSLNYHGASPLEVANEYTVKSSEENKIAEAYELMARLWSCY